MAGIQTSNGKAFEYACVDAIYRMLSPSQDIAIDPSPQMQTAKGFYDNANLGLMQNIISASDAAVRVIERLEPQMSYPEGNMPLHISLQSDSAGQQGDVRDVLCSRGQNGWEIGLSCKHNSHAVKHSRLSGTIDFGKEWFGIPCSNQYFQIARHIFGELNEIKETAKTQNTNALWSQIDNKTERYYRPVLSAFIDELTRLDKDNPRIVPERLIRYLIGRHDFYKVITDEKKGFTRVEAVNINGTLNRSSGSHSPLVKVPLLRLPNRIFDIDYKEGSDNTIIVVCNEGWEISMRIHNASSRVEPSLKFDVNLISLPGSIYAQTEPW